MQALGLAGWVSDPEAPFWASRRSPETTGRAFRRTELEAAAPGIQPKSVFQLVGAGQVGPGSLHGMQALHRLSEAGFAIWPFHRPSSPLIVEIYPRVLIGRAPTRTEDDRGAYLAELPVDPSLRAIATQSVDAFDALVSAVRMAQHAHELRQLAVRPDDLPEGRIWKPAARRATRSVAAVIDDYEAAWNEPDAERRAALLTSSCAAGVRYADPESDVTGLEALSAVIASFQTSYPGHVLRRASAVDAHHDLLRFSWLVERPDGTTMSGGLDACQLAPDGRLAVIAGFFGEL